MSSPTSGAYPFNEQSPCGRNRSRSVAPEGFAAVTDSSQILSAVERGDPGAAEQLWPLVYEELRKLAARQLARETPGQALQATALVHEAYVRLVGQGAARRKNAANRGGGFRRDGLDPDLLHAPAASDDLLALDEALDRLAAAEPEVADLVKLRYFAGLTIPQVAATPGVSRRTADAWWAYARARLLAELSETATAPGKPGKK